MPSIETVRGLTVPTVAGDIGVWGGELNTTINDLAAILGTQISLFSSSVGVNTTLTSSQAQASRILVTNTSSQGFQLNMPASTFCLGRYSIGYISPQLQPLTITAGSSGTGGTNASISGTSSGLNRGIYDDGVNIFFDDQGLLASFSIFPLQSGLSFGFDGSSAPPPTGIKPGVTMPFSLTIQSWAVASFDVAGSISVDVLINGTLASSHNTPTLNSSFNASGSASGWAQNTISSGSNINPTINSVSGATKLALTLFGVRTT